MTSRTPKDRDGSQFGTQESVSPEQLLDPVFLKPRLVFISLFITAFELLKASVVDRIESFFICGFDETGWKVDQQYMQALAETGMKGRVGQSLAWLKEHGAIDDSDIHVFDGLRKYRHELVHQMPEKVGTFDVQFEADHLNRMLLLLRKIEVWWVQNVGIPTNPDYDGQEIKDEDIDPGTVLYLQMITQVALSKGAEAETFLREYRKRNPSS